ncbi:hypothetical protein [Aidingimonas lacisalsi]|uniref:hypothetical protein n=1 Tax=Aidingimonas lacisalsi TaxID=2604086 RepID=UPI0011D224A8|nr:hypothetical protein [Aidingimonas lacisalsi]
MSLSAIIVMTASIIALWGVATVALSYSLRQEERKLALIQSQGDFEPLSPRAQRDLETWLARHPEEEPAREVRELLELQQQAMQHNPQRFYDWSTIDEARQ